MNITAWLDVAIGLSVVYLGASLFVTIIHEYIQHLLNSRGLNLAENLRTLIHDPSVQEKLKSSPIVAPFFEKTGSGLSKFFDRTTRQVPTYVDPVVFAKLLVGTIATGTKPGTTSEGLLEGLENLENTSLKQQLQALVKATAGNVGSLVTATSEWLDRSLTMLAEGYKRRMRWLSFGISVIVAFGFNIDTITLTTHLYRDKEARDAAVALAEQITNTTNEKTFRECLALDQKQRQAEPKCKNLLGLADTVTSRNASLSQLPIGMPHNLAWPKAKADVWAGASKCLGWLLTALALSLGAPFWFDLLNRFVSVRHGMRKPSAAPKDSAA